MEDRRASNARRGSDRWRRRGIAVAVSLTAALTFAVLVPAANAGDGDKRLRTIVTTDPELDDQNSMVRYLLRSSDFDTEGLIYASSAFHWKGDGRGTRWWQPGREYDRFGLSGICPCTRWRWPSDDKLHIAGAVERYAQVYDNLEVHDRDYPTGTRRGRT